MRRSNVAPPSPYQFEGKIEFYSIFYFLSYFMVFGIETPVFSKGVSILLNLLFIIFYASADITYQPRVAFLRLKTWITDILNALHAFLEIETGLSFTK